MVPPRLWVCALLSRVTHHSNTISYNKFTLKSTEIQLNQYLNCLGMTRSIVKISCDWPKFQPHSKNRVKTIKYIIRPKFFCKIIVSKLLCLDSRTNFQKRKIKFQGKSFFAVLRWLASESEKRRMPGDPGAWELNYYPLK